jgi:hypothetical protein
VSDWLEALAPRAPAAVSAYKGVEAERFLSVRREVRRRAGEGSAARIAGELDALADALAEIVGSLPERAFGMAGGEEDWNVAQAIGHDVDARIGLTLAASLAARDRWPSDASAVVPGIPGRADASRDELVARIERSRRATARAAHIVAGHELDPCPLEHPLVGRLRCGEWLLFAAVHDLMHLDQLHRSRTALLAGVR